MMKVMMRRMMPMMSGTIEKMKYPEKEEMMDKMMPHMMANLSFEEKMQMMQKMMPRMMQDIEPDQMGQMMDTMMPMMMNVMKEKGITGLDMMRRMCPKCISVATEKASEEDKGKLKSEMSEVFSKL
jgi:hypothetical protein